MHQYEKGTLTSGTDTIGSFSKTQIKSAKEIKIWIIGNANWTHIKLHLSEMPQEEGAKSSHQQLIAITTHLPKLPTISGDKKGDTYGTTKLIVQLETMLNILLFCKVSKVTTGMLLEYLCDSKQRHPLTTSYRDLTVYMEL